MGIDFLGSLAGGYQRGKAEYAANQDAKQKAAMEDAKFQLQVSGESRLLQGAAEDAWNKMEEETNAPTWDPANASSLLERAMRFDRTYGKIWQGGSATEYFSKALHLARKTVTAPNKILGIPLPEQVAGKTMDLPEDPQSYGYRTTEQIDLAAKKKMEADTREIGNQLQAGAVSYLQKNATTGGAIDPDKAYGALIAWQVQALSENPTVDPEVIYKAVSNLSGHLGDMFREQAKATGADGPLAEHTDKLSIDVSRYIDGMVGTDQGMGNFSFDANQQAVRQRAEDFAQPLVMAGWSLPEIKLQLSKALVDPATGNWKNGGGAAPLYMASLAQAPAQFQQDVSKFYESGGQPGEWEPMWNPSTGVGYMANPHTNQKVAITQVDPAQQGSELWKNPNPGAPAAPQKGNQSITESVEGGAPTGAGRHNPGGPGHPNEPFHVGREGIRIGKITPNSNMKKVSPVGDNVRVGPGGVQIGPAGGTQMEPINLSSEYGLSLFRKKGEQK